MLKNYTPHFLGTLSNPSPEYFSNEYLCTMKQPEKQEFFAIQTITNQVLRIKRWGPGCLAQTVCNNVIISFFIFDMQFLIFMEVT